MRLSRRALGPLAAALAIAFSLGATAGQFDGVTITHFTQGGAIDRIAGYKELAEEFKAQTGAAVQFVEQPWEQMQTAIINDAIGGTGNYDVVDLDSGWDANVAGYLEPLDARIKSANFDVSDYQGLNALIATADGVRHGIPLTSRSMVMFYREDLLDAAGIAVPKTWEELNAAAKSLTGNGTYGYVGAGVAVQLMKMFFGAYMGDEKRSLFTADGKPTFDSPEGARAIERLKELFSYAPPGVFAMDIPEADQVFLNGEAAFTIEWPDYIQPSLNDPERSKIVGKWAATVPPGPGNAGPWYIGLSSASKNKDAAWAWLSFITSPAAAKMLMIDHGIYATRNSVLLDKDVEAKFPGMQAAVDSYKASFYPSFIASPTWLDWFLGSADIFSAALSGQVAPADAAKQSADLWNKVFDITKGPKGYNWADIFAQ
ncbi:MAG: sugar ABC transporter substrate-binding protein [Devosia nanyangense]|uniref:Sugar ABC transporter substrate-binding protein n=1 Tax=Devosia nanyangense TaxID=1228055 RepID=A0A933L594_9HYPH|nr:sugar ABC transporter substrate-binding protein [Devosia nanyangense]